MTTARCTHISFCIGFLILLIAPARLYGRAYYISLKGSDAHEGTESAPWQTINRVNDHSFLPGDSILFEGGGVFSGSIDVSIRGAPGNAVTISSCGRGRAVIDAGDSFGLYLERSVHVTVNKLCFTGSGRLEGNLQDGLILNDCDSIVIHEVEVSGFQHSGLLVQGEGNHIRITEVYAHDNGFAGIHVFGKWPGKYDMKHIYIGHCKAENNPGDPSVLDNHSGNGILAGCCDSVTIEYCEALENGWDMPRKGNGPVGIWAWNADHVVIQHCISHHNKTAPGAHDGGGFDLDGGVTNSVIQYCLSYENHGAGIGLYEYSGASVWENNTIRYNLSINDGYGTGNACLNVWNGNHDRGMLSSGYIYNNTFYNDRDNGAAVYFIDPYYEKLFFFNNLFLTGGSALKGPSDQSTFNGNVYWNLGGAFRLEGYHSFPGWVNATGHELLDGAITGYSMDPKLADPGMVSLTDPDSINLRLLNGFIPEPGSPVIDVGLDLSTLYGVDPGTRDLAGTEIPAGAGHDPGALEYVQGNWTRHHERYAEIQEAACRVRLFPNPLPDRHLSLEVHPGNTGALLHICIYTLGGQLVSDRHHKLDGRNRLIIRLPEEISPGLYLLRVWNGENSQSSGLFVVTE